MNIKISTIRGVVLGTAVALSLIGNRLTASRLTQELISTHQQDWEAAQRQLRQMSLDEQRNEVPPLLDLMTHHDTEVTLKAAKALSIIGEEAVPAMVEFLMAHRGEHTTIHNAILEMGAPAVPELLRVMHQYPYDTDTKCMILSLFKGMKANAYSAAPDLIAILERGDEKSREFAAGTLGKLSHNSQQIQAALVQALQDPSERVRNAAVEGLAYQNHNLDQTIDHLVEGTNDARAPLDKDRVIATLKTYRTDKSLEALDSLGVPPSGYDKYDTRKGTRQYKTGRSAESRFQTRRRVKRP